MKKIAPRSDSLAALRAFTESDDDGAFRLFARLCRASPALREWLWEEFARKPKTRAKLASALARKDTGDDAVVFSVESHSLRIEAAALREKVPARIYGGLTWNEVEGLVRHYQAGKLDLGTFLLVNEWQHKNGSADQSPRLTLASVEWFGQVVREGDTRLLRHVGKTLRFLASLEKAPKRRGLFGHTDWWKLNVLFTFYGIPANPTAREIFAHTLPNWESQSERRTFAGFAHGIKFGEIPERGDPGANQK
jgi:hypothetical protein